MCLNLNLTYTSIQLCSTKLSRIALMKQMQLLTILFLTLAIPCFAQVGDNSVDEDESEEIVEIEPRTPGRMPPTPKAPRKRREEVDLLGVHAPRNLRQRFDEAAQALNIQILVNAMIVAIPVAGQGRSH